MKTKLFPLCLVLVLSGSLAGCAGVDNKTLGLAGGAAAGGLIGGAATGSTTGAVLGAVGGGALGYAIGKNNP